MSDKRIAIGEAITKIDMRPTRDKNGTHYDPVIWLENGASIAFRVSESHDGSFYGVTPIFRKAK